jgi:hypothetical protein
MRRTVGFEAIVWGWLFGAGFLSSMACSRQSPDQLGSDAAAASDRPTTPGDTRPEETGCPLLLCPAQRSEVALSGYVDLTSVDTGAVDVDGLELTVCLEDTCVLLPRAASEDTWAAGWACADAGSTCAVRVFGGSQVSDAMYAYVALTGTGGSLYSVSGSVAFLFRPSVADVASTTRITIGSGDVTYLDASSTACTVSSGCCGGNQSCTLIWN